MAQFTVKKKAKLSRVEIIPLEKVETLKELIYNPFERIEQNFEFEEFDKEPEEVIPPEPIEIKQRFYREFVFTNVKKLVQLDLRRIPPISVLKEKYDSDIEKSYQKGWDDCFKEYSEKFDLQKSEFTNTILNFDSIINEINYQFVKELKNFEDIVLNLSITIAEHILEKEISVHSSIVIDQVRKAISSIEEEKIYKIRVHPKNVDVLKNVKSTLFSDKSKLEGVIIIADDSVDLGGCILETSAGIVDGKIKTQLEIVSQQIFNSGIEEEFLEDNEISDESYSIEYENSNIDENFDINQEENLANNPIISYQEEQNLNIENQHNDIDFTDLGDDGFLDDINSINFGDVTND